MRYKKQQAEQRIEKAARRLASGALDLLFPRRCPVCDKPVRPVGALVCAACEGSFRPAAEPACRKCGRPLRRQEEVYCRSCLENRHFYECGAAAFTYRSCAGAIYRFKYGGRQEYAAYFGRELARAYRARLSRERFDLLVPAPLHRERLRARGYNQAALLAEALSPYIGVPVCKNALLRTKNTAPLKAMSASARQNNLKKAFQASVNDVNLKSIIVVDDIYTTGATVDACAQALYAAGAARVCFLALAVGEESEC